jgi:hypothetical protein
MLGALIHAMKCVVRFKLEEQKQRKGKTQKLHPEQADVLLWSQLTAGKGEGRG